MSVECDAAATTVARSVSRSTRRRAWPSFDSTSFTECSPDQSGAGTAVANVDEPLRHGGAQLGQVTGEDDPTMVDDHDVFAQVLDQVELVAGEQHGCARCSDLCEQLAHVGDRDRVEPGERLVEHEQIGFVDECRDQLHALLVAVRQRIETVTCPVGEAEPLEPGVDTPTRLLVRPSAQPAQVDQLVPHPHPRIQAPLLGHVPETRPLRCPDRRSAPPHRARVQLHQPEHRPHRRRLPGAIRAHEPGQPPRSGRERAPVERGHRTEPLARPFELQHVVTSPS